MAEEKQEQPEAVEPTGAPAPDPEMAKSRQAHYADYTDVTPTNENPPGGVLVEQTLNPPSDVPATASFTITPNPAAVGEVVTVDASGSTEGTYPIRDYTWDFGDTGPEIGGVTMTHSYTSAGTYTVTLTVTDAIGAIARATDQLTVA
jgi:PKD repeat protein